MKISATRMSRREFAAKSALGMIGLGAAALPAAGAAVPVSPSGETRRGGIWKIIRNPRALEAPPGMPAGETWRYMLNYPFQVAPNLAGAYCNIKTTPGPGQDFGGGADIVLFDHPTRLRPERAVKVARNHLAPNPNNGGRPAAFAKFPGMIGFVPLGAKRPDGSPHPHAGTGFVLVSCTAWPLDDSEGFSTAPDRTGRAAYRGPKAYRPNELYQLSYDGTNFRVGAPEVLQESGIIQGYNLDMTGMGCAIADGDDLLAGMSAHSANHVGAGLQRWSRINGAWRPGAYEQVTPDDDSIEPTLMRDLDGGLLFCARGRRHHGPPMRIWRQAGPGAPWELRLNINRLLPSTPVTLNRAVDGTPYVAGNFYEPEFRLPEGLHSDGGISRLEPMGRRAERSTISVWALNAARDGFDAQFIARDPRSEFGLPPHGTTWAVDHPVGSPVRLADGRWHSLMGYRLLEWKENTHFIPPSPLTGCYLDEIVSFGQPAPLWDF